jgi:hypothetical protein
MTAAELVNWRHAQAALAAATTRRAPGRGRIEFFAKQLNAASDVLLERVRR